MRHAAWTRLLAAVAMFWFPASWAAAQDAALEEECLQGVGCLDQTVASVAELLKLDCDVLVGLRERLTAKRAGSPLTIKQRTNLRLIARAERQKKCLAVAGKGSSPKKKSAPAAAALATAVASQPGSGAEGGAGAAEELAPIAAVEPGAPLAPAPAEAAAKPKPQPLKAVRAPAAAAPADAAYVTQTVFFATDRQGNAGAAPNERYGGERGELTLGTALVSIPKDHRIGLLEAPSLLRLEFSEDPARHVVLLSLTESEAAAFYADVAARVKNSAGRSAFIFVHGYNVTFKDAARRTAQMAYDLKFDGAPAFFSWPSQGTTLGYTYDEGNVEWAVPDLKRFITEFAASSGADNLFLVGHSMGTRALTAALKELFLEDPAMKQKIREVILAAPDIDADVFRRSIAPAFAGTDLVTLYASSRDLALSLSRRFNGHARAGDSDGGPVVVDGVSTIEASDVATDFVGHAYYGGSTSIITDIYQILRGNRLPSSRPHLRAISGVEGDYWKFERAP